MKNLRVYQVALLVMLFTGKVVSIATSARLTDPTFATSSKVNSFSFFDAISEYSH